MYTYYVMSDSDHTVQLLAVCSQSGRSTVFHHNGAVSVGDRGRRGQLLTIVGDHQSSYCELLLSIKFMKLEINYVISHLPFQIHYQCTPTSGDIFNRAEVRTKHWEWDALSPHVHAPPFQPVYFQVIPPSYRLLFHYYLLILMYLC